MGGGVGSEIMQAAIGDGASGLSECGSALAGLSRREQGRGYMVDLGSSLVAMHE